MNKDLHEAEKDEEEKKEIENTELTDDDFREQVKNEGADELEKEIDDVVDADDTGENSLGQTLQNEVNAVKEELKELHHNKTAAGEEEPEEMEGHFDLEGNAD